MSDVNQEEHQEIDRQLIKGLEAAGLKYPPSLRQKIIVYIALMIKWNRSFNLTSVRQPKDIIPRHILDSLSILPFLTGKRVLDVGSGAGLPGIPLSIFSPEHHFVLIDSRNKKTRFLLQARQALNLNNVEVINQCVEDYQAEAPFDCIMARAFSDVPTLLQKTEHLSTRGTRFLIMKGAYPRAELVDLPTGFTVQEVKPLMVPGLQAERHVVIVTRD